MELVMGNKYIHKKSIDFYDAFLGNLDCLHTNILCLGTRAGIAAQILFVKLAIFNHISMYQILFRHFQRFVFLTCLYYYL